MPELSREELAIIGEPVPACQEECKLHGVMLLMINRVSRMVTAALVVVAVGGIVTVLSLVILSHVWTGDDARDKRIEDNRIHTDQQMEKMRQSIDDLRDELHKQGKISTIDPNTYAKDRRFIASGE